VRTLVVAPQPFFSYRGTPFSVYYRTRVAAGLGWTCDLLTYGQGLDVDLPGCRIYRIPALRWLGEVRVGPSLLKSLLDVLMTIWTIALLCRRRYAIVHAHEEAVFWCLWLKPLFRFRLIYDMHSSLPQQLDNFRFARIPFLRTLFARWEARALRKADAVITVCPALQAFALAHGAPSGRTFLIENSIVDPIAVRVDAAARAAEAARADEARRWVDARKPGPTLIYAGTLEPYQGIDLLLEAFALVSREMPEAGLLIAGGSPGQIHEYRQLTDRQGTGGRTYFAGWLNPEDTRALSRQCAAALSPRTAGNNTPMKIYELIAHGVPLVATRIESHTQVLNDEVCTLTGIAPPELADGILRVLKEPDRAREKAARAVDWYETYYSRRSYTDKLRRLIAVVSG
jgi:glycosyltransferase involved in cell wall biosynthesis